MKFTVCFRQGYDESHRYLRFPSRNPIWQGGYDTAHDFGSREAAQKFVDDYIKNPINENHRQSRWLAKWELQGPWDYVCVRECSWPFVTTEDLL